MSAERRELLEEIVERRLVGDGDAHLDARRVVVGLADVERAGSRTTPLTSMILSKIADSRPESIRWPSASIVSAD